MQQSVQDSCCHDIVSKDPPHSSKSLLEIMIVEAFSYRLEINLKKSAADYFERARYQYSSMIRGSIQDSVSKKAGRRFDISWAIRSFTRYSAEYMRTLFRACAAFMPMATARWFCIPLEHLAEVFLVRYLRFCRLLGFSLILEGNHREGEDFIVISDALIEGIHSRYSSKLRLTFTPELIPVLQSPGDTGGTQTDMHLDARYPPIKATVKHRYFRYSSIQRRQSASG